MQDNLDITLSLSDEESISKLKITVFEEELKGINTKSPILENQVDIKSTYFLKGDNNHIEAGIFVRNGLRNKICLEAMPLVLQDFKGKIVATELMNFKRSGIIPPYSARPYTVNFQINDSFEFDEQQDYSIKFEDVSKIEAIPSVYAEIENIPVDMSFEEESEIREFIDKLPALKTGELTISAFKLSYNNNGGLDSIIILRNGSDKTVDIDRLPISLVNEKELIVARKVFEDKEELKISPKRAKLIKLQFMPYEVSPERHDLSKCKVAYR